MGLNKNSKIFLAGHKGLVGSSILRYFKKKKYKNIVVRSKRNLDLLNQSKTEKFLKNIKPEFVIIAAAKVGGIDVNQKQKAEFIYQNLMIQTNLIHASYRAGIKKYLLNGKLEPTNDAYAIAKIAGVKMCEAYNKQYKLNYICLMPTNLYGPNDNYNLYDSHFFPALISKIYQAKLKNKKNVIIWGNGKVKRELMYVDDLADACEFFLKKKN